MQVQLPGPESYVDFKAWGASLIGALQTLFETSRTEIGSIKEFRGTLPAEGYLLANGTVFDQLTYPELYAKLGTNVLPTLASAYGAGNVVGIKT